jgi:monovalent cation:H+ antiporter, CPA1 family
MVLFGRQATITQEIVGVITSFDFSKLLMDVMLGYLLFAGAFHVDAVSLKKLFVPVTALAVLATVISTVIIGFLVYFLFGLFGHDIPLIYCLLFGSLISPTDPIAVLGILKDAKISKILELKITGESLFNDGVAVVIFASLLEIAHGGTEAMTFSGISYIFVKEAIGGLAFGLALGYGGFWAMRSIDNYKVEVLITLVIVMIGYALAQHIHVSGPLAMVVAGMITGNKGKAKAMSDTTRDYVTKFWELIDEILNAVLFLLIGFEMLVISLDTNIIIIGCICIVLVLAARWISVAIPVTIFRSKFEKHAIRILTWGGLRGGISVALALSLPAEMYREQFVTITYVIVIFSILVQGLTVGKVAKKYLAEET